MALRDDDSFTLEDTSKCDCKPAKTTVQLSYHNLKVCGEKY